jgi:hypothetical protein
MQQLALFDEPPADEIEPPAEARTRRQRAAYYAEGERSTVDGLTLHERRLLAQVRINGAAVRDTFLRRS